MADMKDRIAACAAKKNWRLSLARLGLRDADLAGVNWAALDHVTSLDLSGNQLTHLPAGLAAQMPQLTELSAYKNQMEVLAAPGELPFLRSLHTLLVSDNRLKSLPSDIGRLRSLRVLSLSSNRLTTLPAQLGQLRALESVELLDNPVSTGAGPETVRRAASNVAPLLSSLPDVGLLGFGALLGQTAEGRGGKVGKVTLVTRDAGRVERWLHRSIVEREPMMRGRMGGELGDGSFDVAVWDKLIGFLYTGTVRVDSREEMEALSKLVRTHRVESMLHLVEKEERENEQQQVEKKVVVAEGGEEQKEEEKKKEFEVIVMDDYVALGVYCEGLLERQVGDFEIECEEENGETSIVWADEAILESRMDHFRAMLAGDWRETQEGRVRVGFGRATVMSVLEWVYTDRVGSMFECDLVETLRAARFFGIGELSLDLQTLIADNLDADNASHVLEFATEESSDFPMLFRLCKASALCKMKA